MQERRYSIPERGKGNSKYDNSEPYLESNLGELQETVTELQEILGKKEKETNRLFDQFDLVESYNTRYFAEL